MQELIHTGMCLHALTKREREESKAESDVNPALKAGDMFFDSLIVQQIGIGIAPGGEGFAVIL